MFNQGDRVICINDKNFTIVITTEEDKSIIGKYATSYPKEGDILTVDEVLGEFIRFDKCDNQSFNWFHEKYFTLLPYSNKAVQDKILSLMKGGCNINIPKKYGQQVSVIKSNLI